MVTQPYVYIDPPEVEPYRYGLFSIAKPITGADEHWMIGGVEFDSLAAYAATLYPVGVTQFGGAGGVKALPAYQPTTKAFPFSVFAGINCGSVGCEEMAGEARAKQLLELVGQHAVESELWTSTMASPTLSAPVDASHVIVSPTATSLRLGVAALENWLADNYAGRGTLHGKRSVAIRAAGLEQLANLDPDNPGEMITPLGTRWAFGGGYAGTGPVGSANATPTGTLTWIYATGVVSIVRGESFVPAGLAEALNRTTNQVGVIAEQEYLITVDGPIGSALVDLSL